MTQDISDQILRYKNEKKPHKTTQQFISYVAKKMRDQFQPEIINIVETEDSWFSSRYGTNKIVEKRKKKTGMDIEGGYDNKAYIVLEEMLGTAFIMIAINCG